MLYDYYYKSVQSWHTWRTLNASVDMMYVPREDGYIIVHSLDFPDKEYFHLSNESEYVTGFWGNYLRGAVLALQQDFVLKKGLSGVCCQRDMQLVCIL